MSLETIYDRHIWVVERRPLQVRDDYGNVEIREVKKARVKARRSQSSTTEVDTDRSQSTQRFRYLVPAGTAITSTCKIVDIDDNEQELEVIGVPEIIKTQFVVHHIEFEARLIEG